MRYLTLTLLPLLLVACDQQPVAPDLDAQNLEVGPLSQATHDEVRFVLDLVDNPADCTDSSVGEVLLLTGRITIVRLFTTSNSGNVNRRGYIIFDPATRSVGAESGEVWTINATSSGSANHTNIHGDGTSGQNTINEFYTNLDGDHLHVRSDLHFTVDANGNTKVFRDFEATCNGG